MQQRPAQHAPAQHCSGVKRRQRRQWRRQWCLVAVAAAEEKEAPTAVAAAATRRGGRTRWRRRAEGGAGRWSPLAPRTPLCVRGGSRGRERSERASPRTEGSSAERAREVMTTSRRCSGATKPAYGLAERSCSLVQPTVQESRPQTDSEETAPGKEHSIQYLWTDGHG